MRGGDENEGRGENSIKKIVRKFEKKIIKGGKWIGWGKKERVRIFKDKEKGNIVYMEGVIILIKKIENGEINVEWRIRRMVGKEDWKIMIKKEEFGVKIWLNEIKNKGKERKIINLMKEGMILYKCINLWKEIIIYW